MTPERWKKLDALFHEALGLQGEARAAHLAKVCGNDEQLRVEVERLLAAHERESSFIDSPILAEAAALTDDGIESPVGRRIGHYKIVSLLGRGGMGEVYLAEDSRLERKVALKVLPAAFTQNQDRVRRFEREAKAASALNHPNILTIHEIGEVDGAHYIVSEFVEGETLRALIERGRLGVSQAMAIADQVAGALGVAHQAGIIHRDIKPENVMARPDGLVKVLDFGLAKLTERPAAMAEVDSQAETIARLSTEPGVVMGTVSYMSPEQARGLKVDHRTDIFSLGVMLYEMVAGRRPFEGATTSDVIAALLTAEPPPLRGIASQAPVELERITEKCLAKERGTRYQSAKELIAELMMVQTSSQTEGAAARRRIEGVGARLASPRWPLMAALAALLIVGLVWFLSGERAPVIQPDQIKSLAVLPLENLSGDPAQEYFADGMTESLINSLSQLRQLKVIARTTAFRYKGKDADARTVGRDLKVDAVVTGKVVQQGDSLLVQVDLVNTEDGAQLWGERYNQKLSNILTVQEEIARQILEKLRLRLTVDEQKRIAKRQTENIEAYQLYLKGGYYAEKRTIESYRKATEHYKQALDLDPNYARAWVGLADAYFMELMPLPPKEKLPRAKAAAMKALAIDETLGEAHTSLARVIWQYDWDWAAAEREFKRALELDPGSAFAHRIYGYYLSSMGRLDESLLKLEQSQHLDPLSLIINLDVGQILLLAGRTDEAMAQFRKTQEMDPNFRETYHRLGIGYCRMGKYAEAVAELERADALVREARTISLLGYAYGLWGKRVEAVKRLDELKRLSMQKYVTPYDTAVIYAGLGEKDQAFDWLQRACDEREPLLVLLKVWPTFDSLRADPRFANLIRRVGLPL
jgi:serine/threonine-protein kinase